MPSGSAVLNRRTRRVAQGFSLAIAILLMLGAAQPTPTGDRLTKSLRVKNDGEVTVTLQAGCARCDWGVEGREAAVLRVSIDGRYSQHVVLSRGEALVDYKVALGALQAGDHQLAIERDSKLSAAGAGAITMTVSGWDELVRGASDDYTAHAMAPIVYARPNTVGRFTDVPLLMWYEVAPTARGRQFRYSVIFSNEDGGTATDRLMATWGRTTDIEFIYGVEVDAADRVIAEEFQGPGHEVPPFRGRHEGRHPLVWVSTDNNMVSESGPTDIRYAPAPVRYDLRDRSREVVMDDHPWSYVVAASEMSREGKIVNGAAPGSGKIPDLRRYVHVEACTALEDAALSFGVHAIDASGAAQWYESDRGVPDFRIVRSGCFRGAVPLPFTPGRVDAVRFRAYSRPPRNGEPARPSVVLARVNKVFTLDEFYLPRASLFSWIGSTVVRIDGDPIELRFSSR